jgi:hypothetical protein
MLTFHTPGGHVYETAERLRTVNISNFQSSDRKCKMNIFTDLLR